ncbi:MAG: relaxase domain-containing protein [Hyphomicrobiales bacterium]|nr:relaxase domain-containing protein [Hyphomicrobiales bacterium]
MIAARFTHYTTREGDPNIHTHCVLMNVAGAPKNGGSSRYAFQHDIEKGSAPPLDASTVILIDEAGMAGTRGGDSHEGARGPGKGRPHQRQAPVGSRSRAYEMVDDRLPVTAQREVVRHAPMAETDFLRLRRGGRTHGLWRAIADRIPRVTPRERANNFEAAGYEPT